MCVALCFNDVDQARRVRALLHTNARNQKENKTRCVVRNIDRLSKNKVQTRKKGMVCATLIIGAAYPPL
jgi:hypothetical protein